MEKAHRSKLVARVSVLVALSVMADLFPLPRVFFGMKVDLVGTVWVTAFLLYGLETAVYTSLGTFVLMSAYGPTGFVGASMKLIATAPMFLVPWIFERGYGYARGRSGIGTGLYGLASASAVVIRVVLAFALNYYWAIPVFLGMPISEVLSKFFGGSVVYLFFYVAGLNTAQGVLDSVIPWLLVFKFRLKKLALAI